MTDHLSGRGTEAGPAVWRAAVVVAVVAFVAAALGIGVPATPREPVAVDEPQYLLTALSLVRDGDLDIANQLAERQWRGFTPVEPPLETVVQPDGEQISPHDPLLPIMVAVPMGLGGWVAVKLTLALLAGALAALTLWVAVRRFGVRVRLAAVGVGMAAASAPLAVYGQQVYPELPAALACLVGVAVLTGRTRHRELILLAVAVIALPWLSVKYAPVAAALAAVGVVRWWHARQRRAAVAFAATLVVTGAVYLVVHLLVWGGVTAYASGDHFQEIGEFGVVGTDPNYLRRAWRLIDLLVDRKFGLVAWQPAWLLVVPALAALAARRPNGALALSVPFAAGWLVATFPALTMHGHWWPGRQVVVVLPLALLAVLWWSEHVAGRAGRAVAATLGAAGVFTYGCLLVDGHTGQLGWVNHFFDADAPVHQALEPLLAHYLLSTSNVIWLGLVIAMAGLSYRQAREQATSGTGRTTPVR